MSKSAFDFSFKRQADEKFVIATRAVGSPWPKAGPEAEAIKVARGQYERGEIEMAQSRKDKLDRLFAIPRRTKGRIRPGYFNTKLT